jgi:hypothetical protein
MSGEKDKNEQSQGALVVEPERKVKVFSNVLQPAEELVTGLDVYDESVRRRSSMGVKTVTLATADQEFKRDVPYQRCAYWEQYDPEEQPHEEDIDGNAVLGMRCFTDTYKRAKQQKHLLSREARSFMRQQTKNLLRTDIVHVHPDVAIFLLEALDRVVWDANYDPGYDGLAGATLSLQVVSDVNEQNKDDAINALFWPPKPVTFLYGAGLVLSDLEVVMREIAVGRKLSASPARVVWGHYLQKGMCLEFGGDIVMHEPREAILAYEGNWMPEAAQYPYFLSTLHALACTWPLTLVHAEKTRLRGSVFTRNHYMLDITLAQVRAFVESYDSGEYEAMRKGTVFDNIPCLDLNVGKGGVSVTITCDKCEATDEKMVVKPGMAPHIFLKQWSRDGWDIKGDGKKAVCPTCIQARRDAKKKAKQEKERSTNTTPPEPVAVVKPVPLHQRQNAARMVLGRPNLGDEARKAAEVRCRELGIPETDIIRISLKAQGLNPDGSNMEEVGSDGQRRAFSIEFKREFVKRALRLPADQRRRLLDANDIHPGMFRRWKRELYAADHEAEQEDVEPEEEIGESLIDGMIEKGVEMAQRVEEQLESDEFSDDLKIEVVTVCGDLDPEEREEYLRSLDIPESMYKEWKQLLEPDERAKPKVNGTPASKAVRVASAVAPAPQAQIQANVNMQPQVMADPQLMFKLFGLFEKGIDKKRGRYQQGWSDERVAREAGVDVKLVVQVREETIGKILTEADIEAIQQRMKQREAKYREEVAAIQQMMVDLENRYDEDMAALKAEMGQ